VTDTEMILIHSIQEIEDERLLAYYFVRWSRLQQ